MARRTTDRTPGAGDSREVPSAIIDALRTICLQLPEAIEEPAWTGTRWSVKRRAFAHVVHIEDGWPGAYARAAATSGPADVLTVRSTGDDLEALSAIGAPYFRPMWGVRWNPSVIGLMLDDMTDWEDVAELVAESHHLLAPKHLQS
jgi:YjbR